MRRALLAAAVALGCAAGAVSAACHPEAAACADHAAARVSVVVRGGSVEVWRGGDSLVDDAACLPERVAYLLDESRTDAWYDCRQGPHRVV
jgi:hypothetical protein